MNRLSIAIIIIITAYVCTIFIFQKPTFSQERSEITQLIDYVDTIYGGRIRHIKKTDGHEHNIYYHRNPWNADGSYLVGVQSDLEQKNWRVVLYDGNGSFIKELFPIEKHDWRLVWDGSNSEIFYTWKGSNLYKYNVNTGSADLLKSFAPLGLKPCGPSLNQSGDRIFVITSDCVFRSYQLPDMKYERAFKVSFPPGCFTDWEDERYIGYRNYIAISYHSKDLFRQAILIYDDEGKLFSKLDGIGGGGHFDFSPDGKLTYVKMWSGGRGKEGKPLEIHVMNIDGTNDRILYSAGQSEAKYVQNLHLSWPDRVTNWFIVSFFPSAQNLPPTYSPPLDEILLINLDGTYKFLARTGTSIAGREMFWAQPLASPSADGKRISFNSNRSGTIDQYILFVSNKK